MYYLDVFLIVLGFFIVVAIIVLLILFIVSPSTHIDTEKKSQQTAFPYKLSYDYDRLYDLVVNKNYTVVTIEYNPKSKSFNSDLFYLKKYKYFESEFHHKFILDFKSYEKDKFIAYCILNDVQFLDIIDEQSDYNSVKNIVNYGKYKD